MSELPTVTSSAKVLSRSRLPRDQYYMAIAKEAAKRSTCPKRMVGCVIVSEVDAICATGYNGSIPGHPHCDDIGCILENGKCIRTVHAEVNAIIHAGISSRKGKAYCTTLPCWNCFKALLSAGISEIIYSDEGSPDELVWETAIISKVFVRKLL